MKAIALMCRAGFPDSLREPSKAPNAQTPMDDSTFLQKFEAARIPSNQWNHKAHIQMAFLYLRDHPFDEALARIRSGIQKLNRANGVADGPMQGYHETVTVAWATMVSYAIQANGSFATFDQFVAQNPHLLAKSLLRAYYPPVCIFSPRAKSHFVEPDLAPLPQVASASDHGDAR